MKLKTRRTLLAACVILFLLIFPLVVIRNFGYSYDLKEKKLVRTGIIYITANPQDNIKIFVNGKEENEKLSVKGIFKKDYALYNLMPQTYNIRVSKDGYSGWEKHLSVSPGLITYAEPLLLSLKPSDNLIFSGNNILNWSLSPDFKKIAYIKNTNEKTIFYIYNIESKTAASIVLDDIMPDFAKSLLHNSDFKPNFYWDNNSENIIMEAASLISRFIALNASNDSITYLGKIQPEAKITGGIWNQDNNMFIFQTEQKNLYFVNIPLDPNSAIKTADNISGFAAKNNNIYYLDTNNFYLYSFPLGNPADKKQFSLEPLQKGNAEQKSASEPNAQIIVSSQSDVAVISSSKDLFIIKKKNGIPIKIKNNIDSAEFSQNGDILLYNSSYEIFTYSIGNDAENLITRLAQKIEKAVWHKDYEHIWFINDNILKNIELDSRSIPNIIDFTAFSILPKNFIYDLSSNTIYYDQIDGDKISIHRLIVGN